MPQAGTMQSRQKHQEAKPTGCFKCGKPGHWSKDCPSASSPASGSAVRPAASSQPDKGKFASSNSTGPVAAVPRKRPNLTPDLLLSEDGLGYVLQHFPRLVHVRGRGHEVDDLEKLLEAYMCWHSRLLPYFSFDQFVDKVEKLGATRRVRLCIRELREKVERGDKTGSQMQRDQAATDPDSEGAEAGNLFSGLAVPLLNSCEQDDDDQGEAEESYPDNAVDDAVYEELYQQAIT